MNNAHNKSYIRGRLSAIRFRRPRHSMLILNDKQMKLFKGGNNEDVEDIGAHIRLVSDFLCTGTKRLG